jgi:hypothetical protein
MEFSSSPTLVSRRQEWQFSRLFTIITRICYFDGETYVRQSEH